MTMAPIDPARQSLAHAKTGNGKRRRPLRIATLVCLAVLVLVGLPGYIVAGRAYTEGHIFEVENGQTMRFNAVEGDQVWLAVIMHHSINALWAGTLSLTIDDGQANVPIVKRYQDWDKSIQSWSKRGSDQSSSSHESDFTAGGIVDVPRTGDGQQHTFEGKLSGSVTYPTDAGGMYFRNEQKSVSVPVEITVIPIGGSGWSTSTVVKGAIVVDLVLCAVLVMSALTSVGYSWTERVRTARRLGSQGIRFRLIGSVKDVGLSAVGALIGGAIIVVGVSAVLAGFTGLHPDDRVPVFVGQSPLAISGLIALAIVLRIVSAGISPDPPG